LAANDGRKPPGRVKRGTQVDFARKEEEEENGGTCLTVA